MLFKKKYIPKLVGLMKEKRREKNDGEVKEEERRVEGVMKEWWRRERGREKDYECRKKGEG